MFKKVMVSILLIIDLLFQWEYASYNAITITDMLRMNTIIFAVVICVMFLFDDEV